MWNRVGSWAIAVFASGCYVPAYEIIIHHPDHSSPRESERVAEEAQALAWDDSYPVKVHRGLVPEGLALSEDGRHLTIAPSHAAEWEFIAEVESGRYYRNSVAHGFAASFWRGRMHEQHSAARQTYCDVQAPLRLLTLTLWNLVPFSWPCWPRYPESAEAVEIHLSNLVRATTVLGGNALLVGTVRNQTGTGFVATGSMLVVYPHVEREVVMTGFALRHNTVAPRPNPPSLPARPAEDPRQQARASDPT